MTEKHMKEQKLENNSMIITIILRYNTELFLVKMEIHHDL